MKQTVEQAAIAFANKCRIANVKGGLDYPYDELDMRNAFEAGVEWADEHHKNLWISVEERLPEKDGYYVVTDGNIVMIAYYFKEWNKFAQYKSYPHPFYEEGVIKAYMPIPSFDQILEANKDVLQRMK